MKRVKREHFIIDGYNVVNAWPELIALRDNLEHARDRLVSDLIEYGEFQHYDITIVFDALFTAQGSSYEKINEHLDVIYTDAGETADSYIEKLAYDLVREGKEVHVVTSDGIEQSVILGAGAYRMPSLEMRKAVLAAKKKIRDEYTENPLSMAGRRELSGRIDDETARKLDKIRKNRN